eukprot:TRINITY_DN5759_c0_g1_i1.p1 TRINITY_DN5759_c0_g1~~TRINITY_DN5759_c0_g1_i1.p1  ORF type:complete len:522 (-),score=85.30 TRINITY_DN5759_c0_g1_i1:188-1753(-)
MDSGRTMSSRSMCFFLVVALLVLPGMSRTVDGRIKTIVILMMENRSFDHLLGWLKKFRPDVDGLTGEEFNHVDPADSSSSKVFVSDAAEFVDPDPGHSYQAIWQQVFGLNESHILSNPKPGEPNMKGFAMHAESMIPGFSHRVMSAFRPEMVPAISSLALNFALFNRWFASVPASTQPNRLYLHSGTSHGATSNAILKLLYGFPQKTIFDSLDEDGLSFGIYFSSIPSTLIYQSLRQLKYVSNFHAFSTFYQHAREGTLPNYVVLEPNYFDIPFFPANDDHPSHDVSEGQRLLALVYQALRNSPQWEESALLVTYDEHGGFFDHVPTPIHGVPSPDDVQGDPWSFDFDRLGVRVPTILVSPWVDAGIVNKLEGPTKTSEFEHSSVPATVKLLFNLSSDFLTQRDRWATPFHSLLLKRSSPRKDCPLQLSLPSFSLRHSPPQPNKKTTEWQQELVQLAGTLVGHHKTADLERLSVAMSVEEASAYTRAAVRLFLDAGLKQLREGQSIHGSRMVEVEIGVSSA